MFGPKVIEVVESPINGRLEVRKWGKDIYVTTCGLTQSGGLIKELWQNTFKKIQRQFKLKNQSWLILGLATGTLAKIISTKYSPTRIVGIELDPQMIRLGKKYFNLDNIPNLKIVAEDAQQFVLDTQDHFDWVLIDLYVGDQLPKFVYQNKFLEQLGQLGKLVIVNHLFYDQDKKIAARLLTDRLAKIFPHIQLVRELTNLLIICNHD